MCCFRSSFRTPTVAGTALDSREAPSDSYEAGSLRWWLNNLQYFVRFDQTFVWFFLKVFHNKSCTSNLFWELTGAAPNQLPNPTIVGLDVPAIPFRSTIFGRWHNAPITHHHWSLLIHDVHGWTQSLSHHLRSQLGGQSQPPRRSIAFFCASVALFRVS